MQIFDEIFSMQILDEISSIQIFDEIFSMHIFDEIFLKFSAGLSRVKPVFFFRANSKMAGDEGIGCILYSRFLFP
jgi:hypothetical protein